MGFLHYDASASFEFDDRLLSHLRTVIIGKLNLHENVVFTWNDDGKQHSLWLHPAMPIRFEFDSESPGELNPAWVELLFALANSPGGLRLAPEPEPHEA